MSSTLIFIFILIILILGFGFNGWTLASIVILLTAGLSFLLVGIDIEKTKANWAEERCDLGVMLMGFLYKPSDSTQSASEFASENFSFCVRNSFRDILQTLLSPMLSVIGKSLDATSLLNEIFSSLRQIQAAMMGSFNKLLEPFWLRFKQTGLHFSRIFARLYSAMTRAGSIAIATLYMAMGIQTTIENFVKFVIKVVIIIVFIIAGLFILLFIPLLPALPLILTVMAALIAGGLGAALGSVGDTFCFDGETKVVLDDGTTVRMKEIKPGDILADGAIVEGVLVVDARNEQMYLVDGIKVSGAHLLWSTEDKKWISVSDYEKKEPTTPSDVVYCLRTTTHIIRLNGHSGAEIMFRDWEELPNEESDKFWDDLVHTILNGSSVKTSDRSPLPKEYPLLGSQVKVLMRNDGTKNIYNTISAVSIGDTVLSSSGPTKVIGVYISTTESLDGESVSTGCWVKSATNDIWNHPDLSPTLRRSNMAFHLITESGSFYVIANNYSGYIRDFTEVGVENLSLTYPYTLALLKKSSSKGE